MVTDCVFVFSPTMTNTMSHIPSLWRNKPPKPRRLPWRRRYSTQQNFSIPPLLVIICNFVFKEWEKQSMVDVTHLEIPAELAMVYAHLKGKENVVICNTLHVI
jgi:hypothetical protein